MTQPFDGSPAGYTSEEDEDTIELELSAEQMLALTQAAAQNQPELIPVRADGKPLPAVALAAPRDGATSAGVVEVRSKGLLRGTRSAVFIGVAAALVSVSGVAYLTNSRARPVQVAAVSVPRSTAPEAPVPPTVDTTPVRFTNPFDATEVFEFPPGTTEVEARDAVAETLLMRAQERLPPKRTREARQKAEHTKPVLTTGLTRSN